MSDAMIYVGIDPDNRKSGYGVVDKEGKRVVESGKLPFVDIIDKVRQWESDSKGELKVIVEAGWLNKGYWHLPKQCRAAFAAQLGHSVGLNHQTGKLLCECLKEMGIDYVEAKPLKKTWDSEDGKITQRELEAFTGYHKRTNQDERDAILIAWVYSNLPIRITRERHGDD